MQTADHTNFVSVLSEAKPVMVFFNHLENATHAAKISDILGEIKKELPLLPVYNYLVDGNEQNIILSEYLELRHTPVLIFYKNGNFHRFKDKGFTKKSILEFIGNKKPYLLTQEEKDLIKEEKALAKVKPAKAVKTAAAKKTAAKKTASKKVAKKTVKK